MLVRTPSMPNSASAVRALRTAARKRRSAHLGDDLGQQRVISRARAPARPAVGVDAHSGTARRREHRQGARRGDDRPVGGHRFHVDPRLYRDTAPRGGLADHFVAVGGDSGRQPQLVNRTRRAAMAQLHGHQVDPGDLLGDRVFHLDPRVDLEEDELLTGDQELDRGEPAKVDLCAQPGRGPMQFTAQRDPKDPVPVRFRPASGSGAGCCSHGRRVRALRSGPAGAATICTSI